MRRTIGWPLKPFGGRGSRLSQSLAEGVGGPVPWDPFNWGRGDHNRGRWRGAGARGGRRRGMIGVQLRPDSVKTLSSKDLQDSLSDVNHLVLAGLVQGREHGH